MMSANKVTLHRVLKAAPEKVFRAFTEREALAYWNPPYGFLCTIHEFNFEIGGTYRMSFTNFSTGHSHYFGGKFLDIITNQLIKQSDIFEDPNLPGEMITTVKLQKNLAGTTLEITQEGIPPVIPLEMCYLGWQESLEKLAKLVEPVIPDA